ncbi:MAG: ScyD/ScyE family protein, partial [Solirubrobacterales bacterium]|nr:ScyD/ScyE family protein [Solirubrobacterales bacterium]
TGSHIEGVSNVAFIDHTLYALEAGAGCSHGLKNTDNSLLRVNHNGSTTKVADLSRFLKANPVANPDAADFEPDGTWFGLVSVGRNLYATEPNHQELDRITPNGHVSRVVDFSKSFPGNTDWRGATAIAGDGRFLYIGTLTPFPIVVGKAQVLKVDLKTGRFSVFANGLSTVLGLTFGPHHRLYVLESMTTGGPPKSNAGTGKVVQITPSGKSRVIATGLSFPTAMTLGPDGALYASNLGFGDPTNRAGEILRITIPR